MIIKTFVRILRGSATPAQIMMACVLGAALGFTPGFAQAPGLIVLLALSLIVLNANLALAALVAVAAKVLSLLLVSVSFGLGRVLLDGPAQGLFEVAINAPVLALCGFEYYVTTGGLVLALILGVVAGFGLIKVITGFRTKMAGLEEGSERYRKWMAKGWVKLLVFLLLGRGKKKDYASTLEAKGKVIRPAGVAFCVLAVVLVWTGQAMLSGPIITAALKRGLEQANGASVDLASADIDLAAGRMTLTGLAMADPNALDTDLFRAAKIEADISATSLLRKRLRLDRVVISDASSGEKRATAGKRVGRWSMPSVKLDLRQGEKTLKDYLRDPGQWQQRLSQARQWIEKLSGPARELMAQQDAPEGESLTQRLEREVEALGYRRVAANHLIGGAPTFAVTELVAEKVRTGAFNGETLDIRAHNLSTHPRLSEAVPTIEITSSGNTLRLALELGAVCAGKGSNTVDFEYRGLSVEKIAGNLSGDGAPPMAGGTMDVSLQGTIGTTGGVYLDLPMQVTLHNTTMSIGGKSVPVDRFTIPLGLRGPLDNLRIRIDDAKFAEALKAAGAGILAAEARKRTDEAIDKALSKVDLGKKVPGLDLGKLLGDLGGKKDADKSDDEKAEDGNSAKKSDPLGDVAKSLTEGLFGKKSKKKKKDDK